MEENVIYDDDTAAKIDFLQLCEDARLKTDFTREKIINFCADIQNEYPILSIEALNFIQFPSRYCCEVGFSSIGSVYRKTKYRNRLEIDNDMRWCFFCTQPRLECLTLGAKTQYQPSH